VNFSDKGFSITINNESIWICGKDDKVLDSGTLCEKLSVVSIESIKEFNEYENHIEYDGPGVYAIRNECDICEKLSSNIIEFVGKNIDLINEYISEMVIKNDSSINKTETIQAGSIL
jgi:hypothetical protein